MLKKGRSWDGSPRFMRHKDQDGSNTSLNQPETTDIMAWDEKQDIQYDSDMVSDGNHEDRTSETMSLLSIDEDADKERPPGGKWPTLKKHKKVVVYQWTGLSKKPSFLKRMKKGDKEEKDLVSEVKKDKNNQSKMDSLKRRSSKTADNKAVSCPVVGSLPEDRQGPEWAEYLSEQLPEEETSQLKNKREYMNVFPKADQPQAAHVQLEESNHPIYAEITHLQISQEELLEIEQHHFTNQLNMLKEAIDEEKNVNSSSVNGLQNSSTRLIPSEESPPDASTVQDMASCSYDEESSSILNPTSAFEETSSPLEGAPITESVDRKCCNTAPDTCTVQDMASCSYDEESSSILNPTSAFEETSSPLEGAPITESVDRKCCNTAPDTCTVQDMASCSYDEESSSILNPTSAFEETSSPLEGAPITESVDRKCCNTEAFMKEITAVKNRQDFLESQCLQLRNRYYSDNDIIMELLREHYIRCRQLLVNMNDLREQQITAIVNMKEAIHLTEEKMAYQFFKRARDIWDEMRIFQSHLSNIEAVQKRQNRPAPVIEANNYRKVMNLIVTNITRGKVNANCLPIILTVLLLCLFLHVNPFMTTPFYTTLILGALLWYGVLHKGSVTLQGSWLGTRVTNLFNDFLSAFEEAREQLFGD